MVEMRKRASFIHIDIPGQEDGAKDLPAEYVINNCKVPKIFGHQL